MKLNTLFRIALIAILYLSGVEMPSTTAYASNTIDREIYDIFDVGAEAYEIGHFSEALKWFNQAASKGMPSAQYFLGVMHQFGEGVPQDYSAAEKWYQKAAEQGVGVAQYNLGIMYYLGLGVPKDVRKATEFFKKAAERGNLNARYPLGTLYFKGEGVKKDIEAAHMWWNLSAYQGEQMARDNRNILETRMTDKQIEGTKALARKWLEEFDKRNN